MKRLPSLELLSCGVTSFAGDDRCTKQKRKLCWVDLPMFREVRGNEKAECFSCVESAIIQSFL